MTMVEKLSSLQTKKLGSWFRLLRFVNRSNQLSNEHLSQYGLTVAQFDTLNQIQLHQPLTQQELSSYLVVTKGGVSQMLSKLEKEELIQRRQEWKVKYLNLTAKGSELLEKCQLTQGKYQASMFDALDDEEVDQFAALVKKIEKSLNQ